MSVETVHPGAWFFLFLAVGAMVWFLGKSPLRREREKTVDRVEKLVGYVVIVLLCILLVAGVVLLVKEALQPR